uniref:NADH-ubiquinone oxidoreductase chain 2 n=1 Tax=Ochthebius puncticollis TaxID=1309305 RepID=A0A7H0DJX6_9COLE|nr:NADH dehydrogenase subunit 2 [Ochthebius puncticollis]QNP09636.1 NADH dehydrogenase subunit 2 [Ochthebius puncticollis]
MFYMFKLLFLTTMMIGSMISISSYSWLGMWMGLEINLLSIVPLLSNSKNMINNEASLKYFITQALASTILLFSIILFSSKMFSTWENSFNMIFNSSLLTKMGAAPFHFWFPEVMEGINWFNCLIMLTWQKLAPMVLVMYNIKMINFFSIIIMSSMLISGIMGLNQTSLRKIMAYSSINHIGWMLSTMFFMEKIWLIYFLIYTLTSINIISIFNIFNIFQLKQIFLSLNKNMNLKMFFIMNFLSLGGLPPFLGFMPKWLTIQYMLENNMIMMSMMLVIMTLLTLYFYMRITFSTLMINMNELNFLNQKPIKKFILMFIMFLTLNGLIFLTLMFNYI